MAQDHGSLKLKAVCWVRAVLCCVVLTKLNLASGTSPPIWHRSSLATNFNKPACRQGGLVQTGCLQGLCQGYSLRTFPPESGGSIT